MTRYFLILSLLLFGWIPAAYADTAERVAPLTCAGNDFIVRFGLRSNDDPISKAELAPTTEDIQAVWEGFPPPVSGCTLKDGRQVTIAVHASQAFPYGMGGGDPDADFSLSLGGVPLYYHRTFYNGYGSSNYVLSALVFHHGALRECDGANPPQCALRPERLEGNALTAPSELKALARDKAHEEFEKTNAGICSELAKPEFLAPVDEDARVAIKTGFLTTEKIDLDNNGVPDTLLRVSPSAPTCIGCGNHYFDGSYWIAFYSSAGDPEATAKFLSENEVNPDRPEERAKLELWGGHVVSISPAHASARYVYNEVIRYRNQSYIRATETNQANVPSSSISIMSPNHSVRTLCQYTD